MKIKVRKQADALENLKPNDDVDCNNLKFEYIGPTKDVRFYGNKNSKELFDAIKDNQIKFSEAKNKENEFLNKLKNIKTGKKKNQT